MSCVKCVLVAQKLHPERVTMQEVKAGYFFYMDGKKVYRSTIREIPQFLQEGLSQAGLCPDDVD